MIAPMRTLGCNPGEARAAAALADVLPGDAPLEQRVRAALAWFVKPGQRRSAGTPQIVPSCALPTVPLAPCAAQAVG